MTRDEQERLDQVCKEILASKNAPETLSQLIAEMNRLIEKRDADAEQPQ
jgi:hypothetical protein